MNSTTLDLNTALVAGSARPCVVACGSAYHGMKPMVKQNQIAVAFRTAAARRLWRFPT
jgi:hypothetical protein